MKLLEQCENENNFCVAINIKHFIRLLTLFNRGTQKKMFDF